jgi:hypothetical protein
LVVLDESLLGKIGIAGGVCFVEDDGALALALKIEPYFTEIVLVFGLEILVVVVVFIVIVVKTLGINKRGLVVTDA